MNYHIITWLYTSLSIATLEQHYTVIAINAAITTKQMYSQHNDRSFMSCWNRKISKIPQCSCPLSHNTLLWNITTSTSLQMWVIVGYEIDAFWGLRDWFIVCIVVCWQSPPSGSTWEALGNNNRRNGLLTILDVDTQYRIARRLTSMLSTNHIYIYIYTHAKLSSSITVLSHLQKSICQTITVLGSLDRGFWGRIEFCMESKYLIAYGIAFGPVFDYIHVEPNGLYF